MLLGGHATRDASDTMARRLLTVQTAVIQHDVAFALDEADPLLAGLRLIADVNMAPEDFAVRLRDIVIARPGIANVSIAWPDGMLRGTYIDNTAGDLRVQESRVGAGGPARTNYGFVGGVHVASRDPTDYAPRTRPPYTMAVQAT